jgi:hypothetical protein
MPTSEAAASIVPEPNLTVNHQIKAKPTRRLPRSENACPVQMEKKLSFQGFSISAVDSAFILSSL